MQYFTSDWHFFGKGFFEKRSRFSDPKEMNDAIVSGIFETLRKGDTLYFLGDIGWRIPEGWFENLLIDFKKHKIQFFWINGNHDQRIASPKGCSALIWRGDYKAIKVGNQKLSLFHYPMYVWDSSHYGSWSLHGHIHYNDATWKRNLPVQGKILNVNCELYDFKPISFLEVEDLMSKLPDNPDLIRKTAEE